MIWEKIELPYRTLEIIERSLVYSKIHGDITPEEFSDCLEKINEQFYNGKDDYLKMLLGTARISR